MTIEIKVPEVAESVSDASVGKWFKVAGDVVKAGDVLLELETDKVNVEVTAPQGGKLQQVLRKEGEDVKVGDTLGVLELADADAKDDESAPETPADAETEKTAPPEQQIVPPIKEAPQAEKSQEAKASPLARKLAEASGISLSTVRGTGIGSRITRADVELAIIERDAAQSYIADEQATRTGAPAPVDTEQHQSIKLSKRRMTIMSRLAEVSKEAVMTTTYNEVDMSEVTAIRKLYKNYFQDKYEVGLGLMSFFLKATAKALSEHKILNAELGNGEIILKNYYHIGVAVASDDGLVVPVIRDVDKKSFAELEMELKRLVIKTKQGKLQLTDLQDGTFTITNGGVFGSLMSTPIINPPQSGILGLHGIKDKPVVVDGAVVIRPMMYLATTYDHRIVEGSDAIRFLVRVKELIEQPALLLVEG